MSFLDDKVFVQREKKGRERGERERVKDVTNKSAVLQFHPQARFHLQVGHELKNEKVFKVSLRFQSHFLKVFFLFPSDGESDSLSFQSIDQTNPISKTSKSGKSFSILKGLV